MSRRKSDEFLISCNYFIMFRQTVRASLPQQIQLLNQIRIIYCIKKPCSKYIYSLANLTQMFKAHGPIF